jgi:RNA polymerase sigma factor (sigma-70 family)
MATPALGTVLQRLRQALRRDGDADLTDGQLLERYFTGRDAQAFEALVCRHGPMVLGVCQRILRNEADAEDAFQAVFLVLVRKASSIRPRSMISNWLFGVAHKTALKAQAMIRKRRAKEQVAATKAKPGTDLEAAFPALLRLLDGELSRLPDKYRVPIVLCGLEGKTIKEAARQLGWPQGTVGTRLARGRSLLARRLARIGVPLSAGLLTALLSQQWATASVSPALVLATAQAARLYAAGQAATAGGVSAKVAALAEGVLNTMFLTKLEITVVVLLTLGVLGAGLGLWAQPGVSQAAGPKAIGSQEKTPDEARPNEKKDEDEPKTKPKRPEPGEIAQPAMMPLGHGKGAVTAAAFSPDVKFVATGHADLTLRIWNLSTGREHKRIKYEEPVPNGRLDSTPTGVAFTADGKRLVCLCGEGMMYSWDANTERVVWKTNLGGASRSRKNMMAASADGSRLVTAFSFTSSRGPASSTYVFDMRTGKRLPGGGTAIGHTIRGLACSPDGKLIATAGEEGTVYLWDIVTGNEFPLRRLQGAA